VTTFLREDPAHPSWVTRSITVREPEFDDADRAAWLGSLRDERRPRNRRGILLDEATNPARQSDWEVVNDVDFSEQAYQKTVKAFEKAYPGFDLSDRLWTVRPKSAAVGGEPVDDAGDYADDTDDGDD
jgi:hypothetical protein